MVLRGHGALGAVMNPVEGRAPLGPSRCSGAGGLDALATTRQPHALVRRDHTAPDTPYGAQGRSPLRCSLVPKRRVHAAPLGPEDPTSAVS